MRNLFFVEGNKVNHSVFGVSLGKSVKVIGHISDYNLKNFSDCNTQKRGVCVEHIVDMETKQVKVGFTSIFVTNYHPANEDEEKIYDNILRGKNLVFEEFHSNVPIGDMLNYLDIYPLKLPARYQDKQALYTKVYITSNVPLDQQYREVQRNMPEVWNALLRRITKCLEFKGNGVVVENSIDSFRKGAEFENVNNPFV